MNPVARDHFGDASVAYSDLRGQCDAREFTDGKVLRVTQPVTDLRLDPTAGNTDRQILYGHPVRQLENTLGLSRDETSGYVGYVHPYSLGDWQSPTHRVDTRATLLFSEPSFKAAKPMTLSCGSLLTIDAIEGRYARTTDGFYAIADHLVPNETHHPDLAQTAEKLIGTPYLWGGNSSFGIDCSGLIQLALQAADLPCPGDSDQQQHGVGQKLAANTQPERNDLMFWKGHVALVYDQSTLIHANAHHMAVALEPIATAIDRIQAQGDGPLLAHKRL